MNRGYIKIWRKAMESGLISNADVWQVFSYLLLNASHKEHTMLVGNTPVRLNPGQLITGRNSLTQKLSSTQKKIRTALNTLEKMQIIRRERANKYSIISVINWHRYQDKGPVEGQQQGQHRANRGPTEGQQRATNKNGKNVRREKEDLNTEECSEPKKPAPEPSTPAQGVVAIPCTKGEEYQPAEKDIAEWQDAYPAVNVPLAIAQARQWCLSNPTKLKTLNGARRFITNWLARDQNKGGNGGNQGRASPENVPDELKGFSPVAQSQAMKTMAALEKLKRKQEAGNG